MLLRKHYGFVGYVGLLLFTPAISSFLPPRPHTNSEQCCDPQNAALVQADIPACEPALRFQLKHENEVRGIAFAANQNRLVTLGCDITLYTWDLKAGAEESKIVLNPGGAWNRPIHGSPQYDSYLAVSPDGRLAAVCVDGGRKPVGIIQVYDIAQKKKLHDIMSSDLFYLPASTSFSTKGDRLAVALLWRGALQWSLREAKSLTTENSALQHRMDIKKNEQPAKAVAHLRGDDVLAVGFRYQAFGYYDAKSGAVLESFVIPQKPKMQKTPAASFYQLALSMDGSFLLAVARMPEGGRWEPDDMIHGWDATTGEKVWTFCHEKYLVTECALSPDGRYVAVGFYDDPAVRLYRVRNSKEVAVFKGHTKGVTCIAFSPDGTMIASGSFDKTAIAWNVKEGLLAAAERPQVDEDFAKCWDTLRNGKPLDAAEAVASLAAAKDDAVTWLDGKLSPARKPDAARMQKLFAQLNHDEQPMRDEASSALRAFGTQIEADVKKLLADNPPAETKRRLEELQREMRPPWVRDPDIVRAVRAVYVLERVGSEPAVKLLKKLADGDPSARLTREAKISLERIDVRKPPKP